MKTFEEACAAVFCRAKTGDDDASVRSELVEAQLRFAEITRQAAQSEQAEQLAYGLLQYALEDEDDEEATFQRISMAIVNGFAQGVAVGIEMERADSPKRISEIPGDAPESDGEPGSPGKPKAEVQGERQNGRGRPSINNCEPAGSLPAAPAGEPPELRRLRDIVDNDPQEYGIDRALVKWALNYIDSLTLPPDWMRFDKDVVICRHCDTGFDRPQEHLCKLGAIPE